MKRRDNILLNRRLFAVLLLFVVAVRLSVSVLHVHTSHNHIIAECNDNQECKTVDYFCDESSNSNSEDDTKHTDDCQLCQFIFTPLQIASTYSFEAVELNFVTEYLSQNQNRLHCEVILFKQSRAPPAC